MKKTMTAALLALAFGGVHAQTPCPCTGGVGTQYTTGAAITGLLAGKMVCAAVGNEQWQEWHNGGASGTIVDYKRGPGDPVDPTAPVGTYAITDAIRQDISRDQRGDPNLTWAVVKYTYGANTYTYGVCQTPGDTYAFCGSAFGGRNITGAKVSASAGLQSCGLVSAPAALSRSKK